MHGEEEWGRGKPKLQQGRTLVLCRGTFPVLLINSSRLSSLAEPGLGAPLSSYLEGALDRQTDRQTNRNQ